VPVDAVYIFVPVEVYFVKKSKIKNSQEGDGQNFGEEVANQRRRIISNLTAVIADIAEARRNNQ